MKKKQDNITQQKIYHKIVLDSRLKQDGTQKVIFRIQIDGIKKDYSTGIYWQKEQFDATKQQLLPRYKNDPEVESSNHQLNDIRARAQRIFLRYYVEQQKITIAHFNEFFLNYESSENFFTYAERRALELKEKEILADHSYHIHITSINRFKDFARSVALSSINLELIQEFDVWARKKKKYAHNTITGFHKVVKKYLNMAVVEKKINRNPYKDFPIAYQDGNRAVLTQAEVIALKQKLNGTEKHAGKKLLDIEKEVLRRFLFSCTTGIRISDTHQVRSTMIKENVLYFTPYKTRNKGKKLKIPLSKFSMSLVEGRNGLLFPPISDKHINFLLKIIAVKAGIDKHLTYHVARDTFGTIFIELGGDPVSLKDIMGHTNIKTTMIYVKMSDRRKHDLMNNFDTFL